METVRERFSSVFRDVFDDPNIEIKDEMTADDVEDWDSLTHVTLVVAVEKEFKIKFALGEIKSLRNVGEMLNLIQKKVGA